jgi:hypothetical protein
MAAWWTSSDGQWRVRVVSVDGTARFRVDARTPDGWAWRADTRSLDKLASFVPLDQLTETAPPPPRAPR